MQTFSHDKLFRFSADAHDPVDCICHLLYEVDHASLSVSHLPVKGQGLQAVVTRKRAPCAEIHGAAGLVIAGHRFPPVRPLFVLWKEWKTECKVEQQGENRADRALMLAVSNTSALLVSCLLQGEEGGLISLIGFACEWWCACLCQRAVLHFAYAHSVNASAYVCTSPWAATTEAGIRIRKGHLNPEAVSLW